MSRDEALSVFRKEHKAALLEELRALSSQLKRMDARKAAAKSALNDLNLEKDSLLQEEARLLVSACEHGITLLVG